MPNDERILETMPTGTLGLIPTASCMELGKKVDNYLSTWRAPASQWYCFQRLPQRQLYHWAVNSAFWFRWSQMRYQPVCSWLRPLYHGGCHELQPNLFPLRSDQPHVTGWPFCRLKTCYCCRWRKSKTYHCHPSIPVRKPSAQKNCPWIFGLSSCTAGTLQHGNW